MMVIDLDFQMDFVGGQMEFSQLQVLLCLPIRLTNKLVLCSKLEANKFIRDTERQWRQRA